MGTIAIEGMHFYAHHGFYKEEQVIGGQYRVDVYLKTDVSKAGQSDDLNLTIDYESIYQTIREIMTEKSKLIEHVAHRIIDKVMENGKQIQSMTVRVSKINPPVKGTVDRVFVELSSDEI